MTQKWDSCPLDEEVGEDDVFGEKRENDIQDETLKDDVFTDMMLTEIAESKEEQIDSRAASRRTVKFQDNKLNT